MVHRSESELTLDEIVFEDRNKEYGAFSIRRIYNSNLLIAVAIGVFIFSVAIGFPKIMSLLTPAEEAAEKVQITEVTLEEPPPLDEKMPPPPPPPPVEPPKIATTKFLPPVIKKDEEVVDEEPPPIVEEVKGNTSTVTQEGVDDASVPVQAEVAPPKEEEIVTWVGEKQTFKGGDFNQFLGKNLKYPPKAQNDGVQGRVFVEFVIEKDGTISNVRVAKGIGSGCDEEAMRVIKMTSGMWTPGKNNGHPVRLKFIQQVFFKLPDEE